MKSFPQSFIEIGETDAQELGVSHGDKVSVISPVSRLATSARIIDGLPEGTLFMPISFAEAPVNELFDIALNSETKAPLMKACSVRIEKIPLP